MYEPLSDPDIEILWLAAGRTRTAPTAAVLLRDHSSPQPVAG